MAGPDLHDEHVAAARAAGLHYVTDAQRGITRKRVGSGFAYYDPERRRPRAAPL